MLLDLKLKFWNYVKHWNNVVIFMMWNSDFDVRVKFNVCRLVEILILLVFWILFEVKMKFIWSVILFLNIVFSVEFDELLIFQGFDRDFRARCVIFGCVKSGISVDFSGFARSGYRSDFELRKSIFRSKYGCGTDSLVFTAGYLFLNVNYPPPVLAIKYTVIV